MFKILLDWKATMNHRILKCRCGY